MSSSCEHEHETFVTVISAGQAQSRVDRDRMRSHVLSSAAKCRISWNDAAAVGPLRAAGVLRCCRGPTRRPLSSCCVNLCRDRSRPLFERRWSCCNCTQSTSTASRVCAVYTQRNALLKKLHPDKLRAERPDWKEQAHVCFIHMQQLLADKQP